MASLTVTHGSVFPAFFDKAVAMASAVVLSALHASGKLSGNKSTVEMGSGGPCKIASGVKTPVGISSPKMLAGPDVSHIFSVRTASLTMSSKTLRSIFGIVIGSSYPSLGIIST